jgi:ferritin-like protein
MIRDLIRSRLMQETSSSRRGFFQAAGGTGAVALVLAGCGGGKKNELTPGGSNKNTGAGVGTDQYGKGDLGIVRYALTLEYIESMFYAAVLGSGRLSGRALKLMRGFGQQEATHVKALEGAVTRLGGRPPAKPQPKFQLGSQQAILQMALALEGLGAAAYLSQVDRIQDKQVLAAALSIHSVEARHTAALASLLGQDPSPEGAFAQPAAVPDVLNQLHSLVAT